MNVKDRFKRIQDYVDAANIVDTIENYLNDEQLEELCEQLEEEYEVDIYDGDFFEED